MSNLPQRAYTRARGVAQVTQKGQIIEYDEPLAAPAPPAAGLLAAGTADSEIESGAKAVR